MASEILSKYVMPGSRVDVQTIRRVSTNKTVENFKFYQSKVYDVLSEDRIELFMPMEKTKLVLLPVGSEYNLFFYSGNGLYQCRAKIVDRYKKNSIYLIVLDIMSNLRKEQRREHYRFSCALEMDSRELDREEIVAIERNKAGDEMLVPGLPLKRSVVVDISGGGLRFISDYLYSINQIILCRYQLETELGTEIFEVFGEVLSVKELDNREGMFEHRVKYINIEKETQEEIIKYIFEEERKHLQKKGED